MGNAEWGGLHLTDAHMPAHGVQIRSRLPAALTLKVDQAVPCGLIVSELVSNAIKYAFPNDRQGKVTVDMVLTDPDIVTLRVTDDGIGLPDGTLVEIEGDGLSEGQSVVTVGAYGLPKETKVRVLNPEKK